ncbi:hypothetical protein BJV82DRAFT_490844, partial [Fennellomyces sp. T-0311]
STKYYCRICNPPQHTVADISTDRWSQFWQWHMEHTARNIWYRALRRSLPTAARLHQLNISGVDSPICRLCKSAMDDPTHFLVECPKKLRVWQQVWSTLYYAEPAPRALCHFIRTLQLPPSTPQHATPTPAYSLTVACTLQAIWQAYWRVIFDEASFL